MSEINWTVSESDSQIQTCNYGAFRLVVEDIFHRAFWKIYYRDFAVALGFVDADDHAVYHHSAIAKMQAQTQAIRMAAFAKLLDKVDFQD